MSGQASKPFVDYASMSGGEMLTAVGDDAYRWAEAFCQIKENNGWTIEDIDHGLMLAWFANAIVHGQDVQRWRMERAARGDMSQIVPQLVADRNRVGINFQLSPDSQSEALEAKN